MTDPAVRRPRPSGTSIRWPAAGLGAVLLINLGADLFGHGTFFRLGWREGHLFGTPIDVLNHGALIVVAALGMTPVIASGGVDLSVGAVAALSGAVAATLVAQQGQSFATAAALAVLVAVVAGAWNGFLVARVRLQPIVATLVLMVAGRGVAQLVTDGQIVTFQDAAFSYLGNGHWLGLPFPLAVAALLFAVAWLAARRTGLGLMIEATGNRSAAARLSGVPSAAVTFYAYVFCAGCAGISGLLAASNIRGADANHAGLFLELDAILAVVVGGTALTGGRFNLLGTVLGALLIQTMTTTLYAFDVSADVAPLPKALVILAVCLAQSPDFRRRVFRRARRIAA